jgi:hypothetical protein
MALPDEAFTFDNRNTVKLPQTHSGEFLGVRHHTNATKGEWINLEFSKDDYNGILIDWYGSPQDLERLGVLLQYTARQAIEMQENGEIND